MNVLSKVKSSLKKLKELTQEYGPYVAGSVIAGTSGADALAAEKPVFPITPDKQTEQVVKGPQKSAIDEFKEQLKSLTPKERKEFQGELAKQKKALGGILEELSKTPLQNFDIPRDDLEPKKDKGLDGFFVSIGRNLDHFTPEQKGRLVKILILTAEIQGNILKSTMYDSLMGKPITRRIDEVNKDLKHFNFKSEEKNESLKLLLRINKSYSNTIEAFLNPSLLKDGLTPDKNKGYDKGIKKDGIGGSGCPGAGSSKHQAIPPNKRVVDKKPGSHGRRHRS